MLKLINKLKAKATPGMAKKRFSVFYRPPGMPGLGSLVGIGIGTAGLMYLMAKSYQLNKMRYVQAYPY